MWPVASVYEAMLADDGWVLDSVSMISNQLSDSLGYLLSS